MSSTPRNDFETNVAILRDIVRFAYEQGFHELGYDIVDEWLAQVGAAPKAEAQTSNQCCAKLEEDKQKLLATIAHMTEESIRTRWMLHSIIRDLPQKRDWLDPAIEREARAYLDGAALVPDRRTGETTAPHGCAIHGPCPICRAMSALGDPRVGVEIGPNVGATFKLMQPTAFEWCCTKHGIMPGPDCMQCAHERDFPQKSSDDPHSDLSVEQA